MKLTKKLLVYQLTPLCLLIIGITAIFFNQGEIERRIILTEKGFSPDRLIIRIGESVEFKNIRGESFWPASDSHPEHLAYPEFDPRMPLSATTTWSFRFDRPGAWPFHDHLNSNFRGEVIVLDVDGEKVSGGCSENRGNTRCYEDKLSKTLGREGLDGALEQMAELYRDDAVFRESCHSYGHFLGEAAYKLFEESKFNALSDKASYCGYGFYHGFMESMLQISGDVSKAQEFCKKAGELLARETSDAEGACYHGIGHGAVDGGDPTAWGDPIKMTSPAIKLCEQITQAGEYQGKRFRCVTGVYNSIEILSQTAKYGLQDFAKNPFSFCVTQPAEYKEGCYTNMLPALKRVYMSIDDQIREVMKLPEGSNTEPIRSKVLSSLIHEFVAESLDSLDFPESGIHLCRSLAEEMRIPCVEGLSGGLMKYGEPEKEHVRGLAFCALHQLKEDERDACYHYIVSRLRIWYSFDEIADICATLPSTQQRLCTKKD